MKKVIRTMGIFAVIFTLLITAIPAKAVENGKQAKTSQDSERSLPVWASWVATSVWFIAQKASSALWKVNSIYSVTGNEIIISTGSIKYEKGGSARTEIKGVSSHTAVNMDISLVTTTDPLNVGTGKIKVLLTNPNGVDVISKEQAHNSIVAYSFRTPDKEGIYTARFFPTTSTSWNCKTVAHDYTVNGGGEVSSIEENNQNYRDVDGYVISSYYGEEAKALKKELSIDELSQEFFDHKQDIFTYDLRNYTIGNQIDISDTIEGVRYDEAMDVTFLEFNTRDGKIQWSFAGNLLSQYCKGQNIKFAVSVVEKYAAEGYAFETIDYVEQAQSLYDLGSAPEIQEYLQK